MVAIIMVQLQGNIALARSSTLVSRILHTLDSSPNVKCECKSSNPTLLRN